MHLADAKSRGATLADEAARWAWAFALDWNCPELYFDSVGIGSGAAAAFRTINELREAEGLPSGPDCIAWAGSDAVIDPDLEFIPGRTNSDMFANRKSQAWWHLRNRFEAVYRKVMSLDSSLSADELERLNGDAIDVDDIISIDSAIEELAQLRSELAQITYKHNAAGKILIDKAPKGHKSPNLADAVAMVYAPAKVTYGDIAFGLINLGGPSDASPPPPIQNSEVAVEIAT